jgi:hypothetical protein
MKCYKHENKDAIGSCQHCGVWLCKECFWFFDWPICIKCNIKALNQDIKVITNSIIKYLAIWIAFSLFMISWMVWDRDFVLNLEWFIWVIILIYFTIFVGFGWSYLNSKKDPNLININVNENLIWLLIRKVFKLVISWFIGWFVWPYQLHKLTKEIKIKKETLAYIEANS